MLRWLVLAAIGFILYKLINNELSKRGAKGAPPTQDGQDPAAGKNMVKDPTCGAYVESSSSVSVKDGETVHHFCSYECRDAFLESLRGQGRQIPEKKEGE
ncbi:MAG: hypothetical protein DELT_02157 [Desulfovibrio sp.]